MIGLDLIVDELKTTLLHDVAEKIAGFGVQAVLIFTVLFEGAYQLDIDAGMTPLIRGFKKRLGVGLSTGECKQNEAFKDQSGFRHEAALHTEV